MSAYCESCLLPASSKVSEWFAKAWMLPKTPPSPAMLPSFSKIRMMPSWLSILPLRFSSSLR
eukprot:5070316-Pyramimonas_sp.AAC.1